MLSRRFGSSPAMGATKDITETYRKTVQEVAGKLGYDAARMAKITSNLIMPSRSMRSPFVITALDIMANIRTMQAFIIRHRHDYSDPHRSTERERDDIEHEVQEFVKTCRQQIDVLKESITAGDSSAKQPRTWLGGPGNPNAHIIAHQHGVVLILSERLHAVTAAFDRLRAARFREVLERVQPKRRPGLRPLRNGPASTMGGGLPSRLRHWNATEGEAQRHNPDGEGREQGGRPGQSQQALLDDETQALQRELTDLLDSAQDAESKVLEISALSHMLSTHVLQQAHQIEQLYNQAVEATTNLERGNKELVKTISINSDSRVLIILCFAVLIVGLLFLDWYDSR